MRVLVIEKEDRRGNGLSVSVSVCVFVGLSYSVIGETKKKVRGKVKGKEMMLW